MPFEKGNPGGGRKTAKDERLIAQVLQKCWERVAANLAGKRLTDEQKDMVALEVVKRSVPKELKLKGDEVHPLLVKFLHGDSDGNTK